MAKAYECDQCSQLYTEQVHNPVDGDWDGETELPDLCPWCVIDAIEKHIEELRHKQDQLKEEYGSKP